jgi:two-component system, OmpR family, phosphate regulon response regulator OmpR
MKPTNPRILVVDDDKGLRDLLQQYLNRESFNVHCADGDMEMDNLLIAQTFDIIILDLLMPDEDALSILRHIRPIHEYASDYTHWPKGKTRTELLGLKWGR